MKLFKNWLVDIGNCKINFNPQLSAFTFFRHRNVIYDMNLDNLALIPISWSHGTEENGKPTQKYLIQLLILAFDEAFFKGK